MDEDQPIKTSQNQEGEKAADELFTIDSAIKTRLSQLTKLRADMKIQREMLTSYLENDETYQEAATIAKRANGAKNSAKALLLKQPEANNLNETIKSMREQINEVQEGLSYYLREYQRVTGMSEFEGEDGELQEIVYVAKLVRKNGFKRQ